MADHEANARLLDRRDDGIAVSEREGHRFFQDDVLAGSGREACMLNVELVRRRDVDRVNARVLAQPMNVRMDIGLEVPCEGRARRALGLRRGGETEARVARHRPYHNGAGHAETGDTQPDRFVVRR